MTKLEYIVVIVDAIVDMMEETPEIVVKYLPSIDRAQSVEANEETLDLVLHAIKEVPMYKEHIVGLDLSGNPTTGCFTALKPLLQRARENGLRLTIHCAEVAGRAEETKEMLESGLMDRIGHGTFLDGKFVNCKIYSADAW